MTRNDLDKWIVAIHSKEELDKILEKGESSFNKDGTITTKISTKDMLSSLGIKQSNRAKSTIEKLIAMKPIVKFIRGWDFKKIKKIKKFKNKSARF